MLPEAGHYEERYTEEETKDYFSKNLEEAKTGDRVLAHRRFCDANARERVFLYLSKGGYPVCQTIDEWDDQSAVCELFEDIELITKDRNRPDFKTKEFKWLFDDIQRSAPPLKTDED